MLTRWRSIISAVFCAPRHLQMQQHLCPSLHRAFPQRQSPSLPCLCRRWPMSLPTFRLPLLRRVPMKNPSILQISTISSSRPQCDVLWIAVLRRIYYLFSFNRISTMLYISASLFLSYFATFIFFITMLSERWTYFFWRYKIINIYNKNCKTYFYPYIKQLMN